jgi:hypothetical protein
LRQQLLYHAGVDHMRPLRFDRTDIRLDGGGRVIKQAVGDGSAEHLRGGREGPHVADMEDGRPPRLVGEARTRAELVRIDVLEYLVEPHAVIE